jgi:hypothetical protein
MPPPSLHNHAQPQHVKRTARCLWKEVSGLISCRMLHVNKGFPNQHYAHRKQNSLQLQLAQGWKMCQCPRQISFCDLFIRHLVPPLAHGDSMHITLMYVTQEKTNIFISTEAFSLSTSTWIT